MAAGIAVAAAAAKSPGREGLWTSAGRWKTLGPVEESLNYDMFYLSADFDVQQAGDFVSQIL